MEEFRRRLLLLQHCRGIGWKTFFLILKEDPLLKSLFKKKRYEWQALFPQLKPNQLSLFYDDLHSINIIQKIELYEENDILFLTYFDELYPDRLRHIYNPPWVIYAKGRLSMLQKENALAVVGMREATVYGQEVIDRLLPPLIRRGCCIISGLAAGIDTLAHRSALGHGGSTIAVLGGGLFHIYPKDNTSLALKMMKEQLVISEYTPFTKPERWMFPMRNRLISGLSDGVLVVEAKMKSGSLITAQHALEQGKNVFAVPGKITDNTSVGTNFLIQEGAKPVMHHEDILSEMRFSIQNS
ncbi:DNA-protecting protein DprA [Bacillus sp. AGMB 02131]|uniref:DNA-protecting protein DprA n=1 Tax=Peribacillus faecalis TaxID=2772559 RepID=A0A927CXC3_9BACI|nr:DNA-processing protein DprA [Peribacillus faecalis]MBD3109457.1 DNA-protecting protein DprA [Peribacillus faecalis]